MAVIQERMDEMERLQELYAARKTPFSERFTTYSHASSRYLKESGVNRDR